jgi:uncharacterized membrane protein
MLGFYYFVPSYKAMDKSSIFLASAIILLIYVYAYSISPVYYLFPGRIILILVFALIAVFLFYFAYLYRGQEIKLKSKSKIKLNPYIIIGIVSIFAIIIFQFDSIMVIISIIGMVLFGFFSKGLKSRKLFYNTIIAALIIAALCSIILIYTVGFHWSAVDEVAYNYYSASLFLKGINPYAANMVPSLAKYNTTAFTVQLNGTVVGSYSYPALSFLAATPFQILGLDYYVLFLIVQSFISTAIAIFIYYKSNYNKSVLLAIAVWLFATYFLIFTMVQYLAVAFLIIAYMMRKRILVSSIFLGLAASTIQLAWFAIPFFFILTLRENGKTKFLQSIFIVLLVFLAINGYFILQGPKEFLNGVFAPFGASKLPPIGANIMEFFVSSYNVSPFATAAISIIVFLSFIILFYFYTSTLKPLIAIVPGFIFFLSWRNIQFYGLAFVPFIILLCYDKEKPIAKDLIKNKSYIFAALALIAIISIFIAMYAHIKYTDQKTLMITYAHAFIEMVNSTNAITTLQINLTNNGAHIENVSFLYITSDPVSGNYILSPTLNGIEPDSYQNYTMNLNISNSTNRTRLYILAFSKDYLIGKKVGLSNQSK